MSMQKEPPTSFPEIKPQKGTQQISILGVEIGRKDFRSEAEPTFRDIFFISEGTTIIIGV